MNRSLHITIVEGAGLPRRRGSHQLPTRAGTDPGADYVMPPVEDPGGDYVMPPVEDPGGDYVMPPVEDPSGGTWSSAPGAPVGAVYAWSGPAPAGACCCCKDADSKTPTPERPGLPLCAYSGFVIVRMAPGVPVAFESLWDLASSEPGLPALRAVLELELEKESASQGLQARMAGGPLVSRPLIELPPIESCERLAQRTLTLEAIKALEQKAATSAFSPLHSLISYWRVDLRPYPDLVEEVVEKLNGLAEVDLAYRELTAADPGAEDPAFVEDQGYLDDAPAGISAAWAWKSLKDSAIQTPPPTSPLTICDLEQGWRADHDDLETLVEPTPLYGANRADAVEEGAPGHHGTAVLGQLAAAGKVKGAVASYARFVLASHYKSKDEKEGVDQTPHPFAGTNGHVAAAMVGALVHHSANPQPLQPGDVLLLEVQRGLRPTEIDAADLDAIRLASALGVIVVEAAGNGGFDLDAYLDPDTGQTLRRGDARFRDSGAIFVGAARAAVPHDRAPFSNFGSRLDCFAWGEAVTSCGFGDLAGTLATDYYTNTFSGTSSASPIIAGAAALVQALHQKHAQCWLEPRAMRALLSDPSTGTRQGPNVAGFIGVMPDLKAIVRGRLALVPDVYMRRHVGDDGSRPRADEEISGSPDILLWDGTPANAPDRFGEGPRANTPAPGTPLADLAHPWLALDNKLYVRLRNRGGGAGHARVRLFASPAATVITPERWVPIGTLDVKDTAPSLAHKDIPQGDTLVVSQAHDWKAALFDTLDISGVSQLELLTEPLSFLAVLRPEDQSTSPLGYDGTTGLPPGPPYFDWPLFRAFVRGPGVAWRNSHAIVVGANTSLPLTLSFLIAGTPDHARHFDFEVIQRLPEKVATTLNVPPGFAAKLRQRQSWSGYGTGSLTLPQRPRLAFRGVRLAAGAVISASFEVQAPNPADLVRGHSLAIRQLWRGEEVGRITWWFVKPPQ